MPTLTVGTVTQAYSDIVAEGLVISQDPLACTECAAVGAPVDLVVSLGEAPAMVDVPNVTGLPQAEAETAIDNAGLTVGAVTQDYSGVVAAGNVISQDPAACSECADAGASVDLVVSLGPEILSDVTIKRMDIPATVSTGRSVRVTVSITNSITAAPSGPLTLGLAGSDGSVFKKDYPNLDPGESRRALFTWSAPDTAQTVSWEASVTISGVVVDTAEASTTVQ